jgi:hypothetical protein
MQDKVEKEFKKKFEEALQCNLQLAEEVERLKKKVSTNLDNKVSVLFDFLEGLETFIVQRLSSFVMCKGDRDEWDKKIEELREMRKERETESRLLPEESFELLELREKMKKLDAIEEIVRYGVDEKDYDY